MSIVTSQQLARYYEQYQNTEVTFNKQVSQRDRVGEPQRVSQGAGSSGSLRRVFHVHDGRARHRDCATHRHCDNQADHQPHRSPLVLQATRQSGAHHLFVTCRPTGFTHYAVQDPDVQIVAVEFTQRPPDDLIQILGTLLEANANAQRRRDERIIVSPETLKKLGLESREAAIVVEERAHRCVLRDVSFSGAKIVVSGYPSMFNGKRASLKIMRADQAGEMILTGSIRRVDEVGGRKDILAVSMNTSVIPALGTSCLSIPTCLRYERRRQSLRSLPKPVAPPAVDPDEPSLTPEDVPNAEGNETPNG